MKKTTLKEQLIKIEKWCSENNISIFYGEIEEKNTSEVEWGLQSDDSWEKYLSVLKNTGSKILIVSTDINDIDTNTEDIKSYQEGLEEEEVQEFIEALKVIKKEKGELISLNLAFFYDGVSYKMEQDSDWIDKYFIVMDIYDVNDDDNGQLDEVELEGLARELLNDEKYIKSKDRIQRHSISESFALSKGIDDPMQKFKISRAAEQIFEAEIKPKLEDQLKREIQNLKNKGLKKIEIKSKLGIGDAALNRHWY